MCICLYTFVQPFYQLYSLPFHHQGLKAFLNLFKEDLVNPLGGAHQSIVTVTFCFQ